MPVPAQIEIYAEHGDAYGFLFIAKGGGSANKSFLLQETKSAAGRYQLWCHSRTSKREAQSKQHLITAHFCTVIKEV
jgi:fumarate hydratase class I